MSVKKYLFVIIVLISIFSRCNNVNAEEPNLNKLLNNQVVVSRQIMCVLEKSPCDNLGTRLKGN